MFVVAARGCTSYTQSRVFAEGTDTLVIYRVKVGHPINLVEWMRARPPIPLVLYCGKVFDSWLVGRCKVLGENRCSVAVRSCAW